MYFRKLDNTIEHFLHTTEDLNLSDLFTFLFEAENWASCNFSKAEWSILLVKNNFEISQAILDGKTRSIAPVTWISNFKWNVIQRYNLKLKNEFSNFSFLIAWLKRSLTRSPLKNSWTVTYFIHQWRSSSCFFLADFVRKILLQM